MKEGSNKGFTLIELIITIVVLTVLVSISMPLFDVFDQRRLVAAGEAIYSNLQFARSEAIKQSRHIFVRVSSNGGRDWCLGVSENAHCDCTVTDPTTAKACVLSFDGSDNLLLKTLHSADFNGVIMDPADFDFPFDGVRGMLVGVNNNTIKLQSEKGRQLNVIVSRMGRVRICSPNGDVRGYPACQR
ncbi:MAG TPA: prepilin-type N-terminal cleavage/methylation domain-containing protein [Halothiobacillus sp.]|nr:prepilin-type N-terminal cleavage/methylation domain-containing protein [Halothiobacillus sp.]